jgi:hypothetical protein
VVPQHPLLLEKSPANPLPLPSPATDRNVLPRRSIEERNHGYLILGEDPDVSQYYGSASSLYLSVSDLKLPCSS